MIRHRLIASLDSPLPLVVIEAIPGAGKRTLLKDWAQQPCDEHRVLLSLNSPVTGPQLTRMIWSALRTQTYLKAPPLPSSYDQLQELIDQHRHSHHRPVVIAITDIDHLDQDTADHLLDILDSTSNLRLIVSGFDAEVFLKGARERGIAFAQLDDQALRMTVVEVEELMQQAGLSPSPQAVRTLHEITQGHPGMLAAVLADHPVDSQLGTVTQDEALRLFLAQLRPERWPVRIAGAVLTLAHVPRFAVGTAASILDDDAVAPLLHRLQVIGLGRMTFSEEVQQRIFEWNEAARQAILQFAAEFASPGPGLADRVLEGAREVGDRALEVATLVDAGRLAEAETVCSQWLWDVLPDGYLQLWQRLYSESYAALAPHPGLLCIRQRIASLGGAATMPSRVFTVVCQLLAEMPRAPWDQIAVLARVADLCRAGEPAGMAQEAVDRAKSVVMDLLEDDDPDSVVTGVVSDFLVLAQVSLQLGDVTTAAWFSRRALRLLTEDPSRLDPHGDRTSFATRVLVLSHRERGLEDPPDADIYLSGSRHFRRHANIVSSHLAEAWAALDGGEPDVADVFYRAVEERLGDLRPWPGVQFARAAMLVVRQDPDALRELLAGHEHDASADPAAPVVLRLSQATVSATLRQGGYAGKVAIPAVWADAARSLEDSPRMFHAQHLHEALVAVRAGRETEARINLERAIKVLPRRGLAPKTLASASPDEILRLRALIEDHPDASLLRLDMALSFAAHPVADPVVLSAREKEVLGYLRRGLSNKDVAEQMFVSVNTVKFHRANLMRKLEARTRDEAIETAARYGL
ncbi:helix-turn-helix transcriptional regulator [Tessaracoccus caeni]|uniref:helix-turn-helix transcriptional regulator n=1 Tax=Tessaracoccus caeni TaxID=3031239 RepID=UPI0023DA1A1F|nr:helix-turn-helix transcriptional regulator [Tessaracoccus caeni]MDF1489220.1 response regulator transcription factor [Tessaracoccus caeni]